MLWASRCSAHLTSYELLDGAGSSNGSSPWGERRGGIVRPALAKTCGKVSAATRTPRERRISPTARLTALRAATLVRVIRCLRAITPFLCVRPHAVQTAEEAAQVLSQV